jgi:hypothetical protein
MVNGSEESDPPIVARKPRNKAEQSAAEQAERRMGAEGNAGRQSTRGAQNRVSVTQALSRVREVDKRFAVKHPRWEPYAGIPLVRNLCGGRPVVTHPTVNRQLKPAG